MNNRRFVYDTTDAMSSRRHQFAFGLAGSAASSDSTNLGPTFEPSFSFDGRRLLVSSTASLWDIETDLELQAFRDHLDPVFAVALSPDGKRVLTGGGRTGDLPQEIRPFAFGPSRQGWKSAIDRTSVLDSDHPIQSRWDAHDERGRRRACLGHRHWSTAVRDTWGVSPLLPGDARLSPNGLKILSNSTNAARRVISDASSGQAVCTIRE